MFGFQYLPASLWVIITGISLILVIMSLGVYFWYRARVNAFCKDEGTIADLVAEKTILYVGNGSIPANIGPCKASGIWEITDKGSLVFFFHDPFLDRVARSISNLSDERSRCRFSSFSPFLCGYARSCSLCGC